MAKIIDDFEDGDISEYSGNTDLYDVSKTKPHDGTYSLTPNTAYAEIRSSSGLANYPSHGDTWEFWIYIFDGFNDYFSVYFANQSNSNTDDGYDVIMQPNNAVLLRLWEAGGYTELASDTSTLPQPEWCKVIVDWQDTITITVEDSSGTQVAQCSATDTTYSSGGIAFYENSTNFYLDSMQIQGSPPAAPSGLSAREQ